MEQEITQAEKETIIKGIAEAVYKDEELPSAESFETPPETEETAGVKTETEQPEDPWKDIPHIRTEIETLRAALEEQKKVSYRLSQAEKRIGSLDSRNKELEKVLNEAREAKAKQPTPEEIEKSKRADDAWDRLKEDAPDIAESIELYVEKTTGKALKADDLKEVLKPLKDEIISELPKQTDAATKAELIEAVYPGWETELYEPIPNAPVDPNTGRQPIRYSPKFMEFIKANPSYEAKCDSANIKDAIDVLGAFKQFKPQTKTAADIKAEQAERLKQSASREVGSKGKKEKSVTDMSEAEIREMVKRKVYAAS